MQRAGQSRCLFGAGDSMFVKAEWADALGREGLTGVGDILALDRGEVVTKSRTTRTVKLNSTLPGGPAVFVNLYFFPTWRDVVRRLFRGTLFGRPRARRLWRILGVMREAGVAAVETVAFGTRRAGLFLRAAFLITAEPAPGSVSLDRLPLAWRKDASAYAERRRLIRGLSDAARSMHEAGFAHGDFFLRNIILAQPGEGPRFYFVDCSKGRFSSSVRPLVGAALDDLATLDAGAAVIASRAERLRFLLDYAGAKRVSAGIRVAVAAIRTRQERLVAVERTRMIASAPRTAVDGGQQVT